MKTLMLPTNIFTSKIILAASKPSPTSIRTWPPCNFSPYRSSGSILVYPAALPFFFPFLPFFSIAAAFPLARILGAPLRSPRLCPLCFISLLLLSGFSHPLKHSGHVCASLSVLPVSALSILSVFRWLRETKTPVSWLENAIATLLAPPCATR
jgi:hypothetical protein